MAPEESEGSVDVRSSGASCSWTAESPVSWIKIKSGTNGTGSGTVRYEVSKNNAIAERTATLTIAGLPFVVTQAGKVETIELDGRISGLAGGCPTITFTLDRETIRTNVATVFAKATCAQIERNMKAKVTGVRQVDGSILATRVAVD